MGCMGSLVRIQSSRRKVAGFSLATFFYFSVFDFKLHGHAENKFENNNVRQLHFIKCVVAHEKKRRCVMKAIVVTDQAAGTAGMKLAKCPEPRAAINDVVVAVYASGFVGTELEWPSTWTDRLDRDRTPSIPGHELAGVVTALGYGTTGLSVGQRVFGIADWYRDGTLAEYVAIEARNLASLPG